MYAGSIGLLLKQEKITKKLIKKITDIYGYRINIIQSILVDEDSNKVDKYIKAYGNNRVRYEPKSSKNKIIPAKALIDTNQIHYLYNGASVEMYIFTENRDKINEGDQVEITIYNRTLYFYVELPVETLHDVFYKVTLSPQVSVEDSEVKNV